MLINPEARIKERIAAVVVTYNRKKLLKNCLDSILNQTYPFDSIILIDNMSTDGTPEFLEENGYLNNPNINYVRLTRNIGGAGGFCTGIEIAFKNGYGWMYILDDDAELKKNTLDSLVLIIKKLKGHQNIGAIASLKISDGNIIQENHFGRINYKNMIFQPVVRLDLHEEKGNIVPIGFSSFVGLLLNSKIVEKIGFPDLDLFLYLDDYDYSIRLSRVSNMILDKDSVVIHRAASNKEFVSRKGFFWESRGHRITIQQLWKDYYFTRNLIYIAKKYQNKLFFWVSLFVYVLKKIAGYVIYDDNIIKRINIILKATKDGLCGNVGKSIDPGDWVKKIKNVNM